MEPNEKLNLARRERSRKLAAIGSSLLAVTALHFATPVNSHLYHDVYDRLYYIPVILAAFFFGLRGGLAAALAAGGLFFLHLVLQWAAHGSHDLLSRYLEIVMYLTVGAVTGALSDLNRKQQRKTETAYAQLSASFEKAKESARLAAIGAAAAGVAHEIRNPLGGVKGAMEILAQNFDEAHPQLRFVKIVEKEIARMEGIVGEFLKFSRPQDPLFAPDNLNAVIRSTLELCGKNLEQKGIGLDVFFDPGLPVSFMDSGQLKQVFLNLVLNGIDAMPEGGTLEVRTGRRDDLLEARILDTGAGIRPEDAQRLFEPFFTTRPHGSGLGLAISRQIVERHGGSIAIKNRDDGPGATATVALPVRNSADLERGNE